MVKSGLFLVLIIKMAFSITDETKERISNLIDVSRVALQYGWIPFIIYVGWSQSIPRPSIVKLLMPLPTA